MRSCDETGCYKVKRFCEPDMAEFTNMYLQRLGHKHCNYIWVGGYMGSWMQPGTPDFVKNYVPVAIEGFYRDQEEPSSWCECGGDAMMGCGSTIGGGGYCGLEQFVSYDPNDNDSVAACVKHMEDAMTDTPSNMAFRPARNTSTCRSAGRTRRYGMRWPKMPQQFIFNFQRKIKDAFDPNSLGDRNYPWLPEGWGQTETKAETTREAEALKR